MIIRSYRENDKDFILKMSKRFTDFDLISYRNFYKHQEKQKEMAEYSVTHNFENIYIAEDEKGYLGYIELKEYTDYFTNEKQGYVHSIAVEKNVEGKGIGKKLMEKAENWSLQKGYEKLVLQLFMSNERAFKFYKSLDFEEDIVFLVKKL